MRDGGLITLAAGPERMAIIDEMQAVMAVVEGHAEHVMDAVGADALENLDELREALDRRRESKPPAARVLEKLLGLEMKMRQYQLGKAFVDAVVERGGIELLNKVLGGAGEPAVPARDRASGGVDQPGSVTLVTGRFTNACSWYLLY